MGPAISSAVAARPSGNGGGDHFLAGFRIEDGIGHIRGDPAGRNGVNQNVMTSELRGQAFGQADDSAFGCSVMRV